MAEDKEVGEYVNGIIVTDGFMEGFTDGVKDGFTDGNDVDTGLSVVTASESGNVISTNSKLNAKAAIPA